VENEKFNSPINMGRSINSETGEWIDSSEIGEKIACFKVTSRILMDEVAINEWGKQYLEHIESDTGKTAYAIDLTGVEHLSSAILPYLISAHKKTQCPIFFWSSHKQERKIRH